jgi:hypothetical protein
MGSGYCSNNVLKRDKKPRMGFAIGVFYNATHSGLMGFFYCSCYNSATHSGLMGFCCDVYTTIAQPLRG